MSQRREKLTKLTFVCQNSETKLDEKLTKLTFVCQAQITLEVVGRLTKLTFVTIDRIEVKVNKVNYCMSNQRENVD